MTTAITSRATTPRSSIAMTSTGNAAARRRRSNRCAAGSTMRRCGGSISKSTAKSATSQPWSTMLSVDEAQQRVLDEVSLIGTEELALAEAHLRVLREDVAAVADVPLADNSAMDSYALRASDAVPLRVIGEVRAGSVASMRVEPGTAMRVMTGAPIPEGADAVAQIEITDRGLEVVKLLEQVKRGMNIRKRGEDMHAGDVVLRSGTLL